MLPALGAPNQDREAAYDDVIANFIWKFAIYVKWPKACFEDAESPIVIGVLGDDDFARLVEGKVRDQTARTRSFKVERLRAIDFRTPSQIETLQTELRRCHIVHISPKERSRLPRILELLGKCQTLTVSDTKDFAKNGGMIEIAVVNEKPSLHIHRTPVKRAELELDPRLLKAAAHVYPESK